MAKQNDGILLSIVENAMHKAINKLSFSSLKLQQMMAISEFTEIEFMHENHHKNLIMQ